MSVDGTSPVLSAIDHNADFQPVYDLTVDHVHTHYVVSGRLDFLVHNCAVKRMQFDENAEGPHSVMKRDENGKITAYVTYVETDPRNPLPFEQLKRVDLDPSSAPHYNTVTRQRVYVPHVNSKFVPGGVRAVEPWEVPNQ